MAVKARSVQTQILAQSIQPRPVGEQKFHCAHIAVVRAPLQERNAVLSEEVAELPAAQYSKTRSVPAIYNFIQHCHNVAL